MENATTVHVWRSIAEAMGKAEEFTGLGNMRGTPSCAMRRRGRRS
jgi:hypothetical protein